MLTLAEALTRYLLQDLKQPAVLQYQLALIVYRTYKTKSFKGVPVRVSKDHPLPQDINRVRHALMSKGVLAEARNMGRNVFLIDRDRRATPGEVICSLDPFAHLSHLSAMAHYGLTERIPKVTFITSPAPERWRDMALQKMQKDLGDDFGEYRSLQLPLLQRVALPSTGQLMTSRYATRDPGHFKIIADGPLRVSTLGRTYLDMLRKPGLCGGMRHVIEIFQEHASLHMTLIVKEIEAHGTAIEKVRAGYLLETYCNVDRNITEPWLAFAQRGGSRRLDPEAEYLSDHSERWCLSINV